MVWQVGFFSQQAQQRLSTGKTCARPLRSSSACFSRFLSLVRKRQKAKQHVRGTRKNEEDAILQMGKIAKAQNLDRFGIFYSITGMIKVSIRSFDFQRLRFR